MLIGGTPLRVLTLSPRGNALVQAWLAGQPVGADQAERVLARRLLDAGLAHPDLPSRVPAEQPDPTPPPDIDRVTIVVPVYADPDRLRACLAALSGGPPVIVVDDGSPEPEPIATVAGQAGARYVRHPVNGGPAAARNTGLRLAATPLVAFVDADCVPPPGFPGRLIQHLADPAVALVAPRITPSERGRHGPVAAYERARAALDMGPHPSLVRPYSLVWYVPSAAMLARREALGAGFDEGLVLGEDVDLVWRLHDAGWQVRYDPAVVVEHEVRAGLASWYRRRVAYNESAAPLLARHPERVPVLFLAPRPALAWAAALGGSPAALLALTGARAFRVRGVLAGRVPRAGARASRIAVEVSLREGRDLARALVGPWLPFALAAIAAAPGPPRRRRLAARLGGLVGAMALGDWVVDRPDLDPLRYTLLRVADESSRGLGIWIGCVRERDFRALLPRRPPPTTRRDPVRG